MEKRWFALGLFIILIVAVSMFAIGAKEGKVGKIESLAMEKASSDGKAKVIVLLNDDAEELKKSKEGKIESEFLYTNAFSAELTEDELHELELSDSVERVYIDRPYTITLQDSTIQVNATETWRIVVNNSNMTGKGQSICIVDTGVDYTHPDLGNCTPTQPINDGNITNLSSVVESAHNYTNSYDNTWTINNTGFTKIAVHFANISLEYPGQGGYDTTDRIIVYDSNMTEIAVYRGESGMITDLWSPYSDGDTIYVRLKTDASVTDYGFVIDRIRNGTTNTTYDWSNCTKVVGGWDMINNDGDPDDDHGHGTHVAGIAAANGSINGVAIEAKILALKAMDAAGDGYSSDVAEAIEWCVNRSDDYNISVISMSIGVNCNSFPSLCHSTYCDSSDTVIANSINKAVGRNISVIIASGNAGNTINISEPSCIENATPVSSIRKGDTTFDYNRNWMVQLIAPGVSINSTCDGGGYCLNSGTSMSTPHVAGAFAIINQYLEVNNSNRNPDFIETLLNASGKVISDSYSGITYSRIDIGRALIRLEAPSIALVSPDDGYSAEIDGSSLTFEYNASDNSNISNCSLVIDDAIARYNDSLVNSSAVNSISVNVYEGTYTWKVNCIDGAGYLGTSSSRTYTVTAPAQQNNGGSGGGGGGGSDEPVPSIYNINGGQLPIGYTKSVKSGDQYKFELGDERHNVTVESVNTEFVKVVVSSEPIEVVLGILESAKLNLSSSTHYDLLIKLESIAGDNANLTIREIYEPMQVEISEEVVSTNETDIVEEKKPGRLYTIQRYSNGIRWGLLAFLIIASFVAGWFLFRYTERLFRGDYS